MPLTMRHVLASSALGLLALGCDSNPDGPGVPPYTLSRPSAEGQPAPGAAPRQPVTKNPREIINPD